MKLFRNHTVKKDDAVANVVVMMLILSVIVIAFAVIVAVYLPSLKETAELQHSEDVKETFLRFSSDVDSVYTRGQPGIYSQVFSLGGGDILFSNSKSAGTVEVGLEPFAEIEFSNETAVSEKIPLYSVTLMYQPVLSYWENQGYNYSNGVVWVGKGDVITPIGSFSVMDGIQEQKATKSHWMNSLLHQGPDYDTLTLVNFTVGNRYLSGNGNVKLKITAVYNPEEFEEYTFYPDDYLMIGDKRYDYDEMKHVRVFRLNAEVSVS